MLTIPIAHGEGNYFADEDTIKELEDNNRVVFKYCDANGVINTESNPNGSLNNIAGIVNKNGNVLGMMPHPERYCDSILGRDDGLKVFKSINSFFDK
jgi:phosphoribosylformylglycinamidine synthase